MAEKKIFTIPLQHDDSVGCISIKKFEALLPQKIGDKDFDGSKLSYMKIAAGNEKVYLKKCVQQDGSDAIFIRKNWLPAVADDTDVTVTPVSWCRYYWFKLWRDRNEMIAVLGLFLALAGLAIDAAIGIGKYDFNLPLGPLTLPVRVSSGTMAAWTGVAYAAKFLGPVLIFWKAARDA